MIKIKTYNKLVRDKIPEIIESHGQTCKTEILDDEMYLRMLDVKLNEEIDEYQDSKSIEEIADVLEVLMAITKERGYSWQDVLQTQLKKRAEKGGFDKKNFLVWAEEK